MLINASTSASVSTTTDSTGHYTISSVAAGKYNMLFVKANYLVATLSNYTVGSSTDAYVVASLTPTVSSTEVDPENKKESHWQIHNGNDYPVTYKWNLPKSKTSGTGTAPPGDSVLYTGAHKNKEDLLLSVNNFSVQPAATTLATPTIAPGAIAGVVTNDESAPLSGALATLKNASNQPIATAVTAANGTYKFQDLGAGTYSVDFTASGFVSQTVSNVNVALAATTPLNVSLAAVITNGSVSGCVTDSHTNAVLAGVSVELRDATNNLMGSTSTDVNGNYSIPGITPGTYALSLSKQDYVTMTLNGVLVSAGVDSNQNVALQPVPPAPTCTVFVTVKSAANNSLVPGAVVTITYQGSSITGTGTTDANGVVELDNQPVGKTATVFASLTGNSQVIATSSQLITGGFVEGANGVQLMFAGGSFTGTIRDAVSTMVLDSVLVTVRDSNGVVRAVTTTGPDGVYSTPNLTPGLYTVTFSASGHSDNTVVNAAIISGAQSVINVLMN